MPALGQPDGERPIALGRYELVAPIGRGGMAEVHLAVQRGPAGFEKLVVIKLVHAHLASEPAFVEMLLTEARLAALIKHPNVVDVYELGYELGGEAGRPFIAMEYLEGEPLLEVLRVAGQHAARLDALSTARVIADTAEGLDAAHRLKGRDGRPLELVHHDVSLGNIVVLYSGLVKLVDFGVAKGQGTNRELVQGKLGYMAPEKLRAALEGSGDPRDATRGGVNAPAPPGGREGPPAIDRRSDIWSLGCVLWEALTLRRLFEGASDAETVRRVLEAEVAPPSRVDRGVPRELDAIVLRALERDPAKRYQTAKQLAADLEEVLRERKYGAKNDRIAQHMETAFAARIAARERVLIDVAERRRPSVATLDAAFGETITHAARTISSTGNGPIVDPEDGAEPQTELQPPPPAPAPAPADATQAEPEPEPATVRTAPNPPAWTPVPELPVLSPRAFSQPRPSRSSSSVPAQPFNVASLLEGRELPPLKPLAPGEHNPFDDDNKTIADMIPAHPDASRSLQSAPSWNAARESESLGQLQRWVQESRTPPRSKRDAIARWWREVRQRVTTWTYRHKLPRWSPAAALAVVGVLMIALIARCAGGDAPAAAPHHEHIEMPGDPPK